MKKILSTGLSLALALTLAACGTTTKPTADAGAASSENVENTTTENVVEDDKMDETSANESSADAAETKATEGETSNIKFLSIVDISKKALDLAGNEGIVTKIDLDKERNTYVYEVEVEAPGVEHEIKFNAENGEIVKHEKDKSDDYNEIKAKTAGIMSIEEAIEKIKANSDFTNPFVHSIELDEDDNIVKYEAEVRSYSKEYDIDIDAKSGEVYKLEVDDDKFFDFDFDFD